MKRLLFILPLITLATFGQTPCENGRAGSYPCMGLDLQARISPTTLGAEEHEGYWLNDVWGWTDPETGREYALVGMTNGTSFVDITDPVNPNVLGVLPEHNFEQSNGRVLHDGAKSIWRDIKVYANHAYVVSEDPGHGVQVFDLTQLRGIINGPVQFEETGHYDGVGQAHNIVINEETGYAYAVGARSSGTCLLGGLHIIDLSDPANPVYAGCFDDDGYTHDAQCVVYDGPDEAYQGMEICFNSNEDEVVVVNVENKSAPRLVSKSSYSGAAYVHQGWLTEDHRYFLSNDELDEYYTGNATKTFIWDMEDLDAPVLAGVHEHATSSIDHNLYVVGNQVYESNYTEGLRVLSTSSLSEGRMPEVAYFDTYTSSNAALFMGSWSNYPFFESGNIIVTDITNGLFILKSQGFFISTQPQGSTYCVGDHVDIPIQVVGTNLTYQWQIKELGEENFTNIEDFERYHSITTDSLHAHAVERGQNGNQYRCVVVQNGTDTLISNPMIMRVIDSVNVAFDHEVVNELGAVAFDNNTLNATSYTWNFGDGSTSDAISPNHTYRAGGLFEASLIAENECSDDMITDVVDVIIITAQPDNVATYEEEDVAITIGAEGYELNYSWQVDAQGTFVDLIDTDDFQGTNSSELTLGSVSLSQDGEVYRCVVTSSMGATMISNAVTLSVSEPLSAATSNPNQMRLVPTVVSETLTIQLTEGTKRFVRVFNLSGHYIFGAEVAEKANLDITDLREGVYLISVEGSSETHKFIVKH